MKPLTNLLFTIFLCASLSSYAHKSINPVIGDESFFTLMGHAPTSQTNEDFRISVHLFYVEQILRKKDVNHLSKEQKRKREAVLDILHSYLLRGKFPKNYDYPDERKPCFIDKHGTLCAVGYLVSETTGREVSEVINEEYKYFDLKDMVNQLDLIETWAIVKRINSRRMCHDPTNIWRN